MPTTWSQIWTVFKNEAQKAFADVLTGINDVANSERFKEFFESAKQSLYTLATYMAIVFNTMISIGAFVYDNWALIAPVIGTVTVAMSLYLGALLVLKTATVVTSAWQSILAIRTAGQAAAAYMASGATLVQTAALYGLNAALYACPITWIILAIIAFIGVIYLAVGAINHFAGTSISATGIIAGTFMVLATFIYNRIAFLWNIFAAIAEFFVNVWNHPMYAVKKLFYNLASAFLDYAISMTSGWDNFATGFVNAIITAVNGAIKAWNWFVDLLPDDISAQIGIKKASEFSHRESITTDLENIKGKLGDWVGETPEDYWEAPKMEMKSLGDAWDKGYKWGDNLFSGDPREEKKSENEKNPWDDILNNLGSNPLGTDSPAAKQTAGNTAKMAKSMEGSVEELKYLRDLSERESINRYTTAEIKVDMKNENHINSEMDIDGVIDRFGERVEEVVSVLAEGDGNDV